MFKKHLKVLIILIILLLNLCNSPSSEAWINVKVNNITYNPVISSYTASSGSVGSTWNATGSVTGSFGVIPGDIINSQINIYFNPYIYGPNVYNATFNSYNLGGYAYFTITATGHYADGSSRQSSYTKTITSDIICNQIPGYLGQGNLTLPATNNNSPAIWWEFSAFYSGWINVNYNGTNKYSGLYLNLWADYVEAANIADQQTAQFAADRAQAANNNAWEARQNSWYSGTYGGSSESVANIAGYIRNQQLPGISTKIDNLATTINNMNSADKSAPVVDVQTLSGALATSGSSIQAVVTVSDANNTAFTYSINGGPYSALPSNGVVSLPVTSPGPNAITIRVKDPAGNVGSKTIIIRKL